jgi:hypothetical protein
MCRLSFALLLLIWCGRSQADAHFSILSVDKGPEVFRQCSRETPKNVQSFWTPQASQISELEQRLVPYLTTHASDHPSEPLKNTNRQYIGLLRAVSAIFTEISTPLGLANRMQLEFR